MDQRDYEIQRIKNNNKILKNIIISLISIGLVLFFIKNNPDYDTNLISLDTIGFIFFIINSLCLLNQVANFFESRREEKSSK